MVPELKSLLVISRQPPSALAAREALDLALAAAAFGVPVSMLFMDAGVLESALIEQKPLAANLQALPMFGVEDVYVCHHSLAERGLQPGRFLLTAKAVDSAEIASLLDHHDQVVTL